MPEMIFEFCTSRVWLMPSQVKAGLLAQAAANEDGVHHLILHPDMRTLWRTFFKGEGHKVGAPILICHLPSKCQLTPPHLICEAYLNVLRSALNGRLLGATAHFLTPAVSGAFKHAFAPTLILCLAQNALLKMLCCSLYAGAMGPLVGGLPGRVGASYQGQGVGEQGATGLNLILGTLGTAILDLPQAASNLPANSNPHPVCTSYMHAGDQHAGWRSCQEAVCAVCGVASRALSACWG